MPGSLPLYMPFCSNVDLDAHDVESNVHDVESMGCNIIQFGLLSTRGEGVSFPRKGDLRNGTVHLRGPRQGCPHWP